MFPGGTRSMKNPPANARDVRDMDSIPGWGRSPGGGVAAHSSVVAWRILWTGEPGGLHPTGSQRVGHDRSDLARRHPRHKGPYFAKTPYNKY